LLNDKGESKLADFGVSGQLSDTMAKRQTVIGTPFWMAPEVIQEVGYDVKADLWSLGITSIEMAEGKPPYSNIHPMRAIFMIPSRPPPKLTEPDNWSKDFNDFIAKCLTKNPEQRPVASELLKHPFVAKAKNGTVLQPLLQESAETINRLGREEAMGMSDSDSDREGDKQSTTGSGTVVRGKTATGSEYSTMLVSDEGNSTMKVGTGKNDDYELPFLAQFKDKDKPRTPNPKYAKLSSEELKKTLTELDSKMDKEIEAIKSKYAKQKKELDAAIQKKKKK